MLPNDITLARGRAVTAFKRFTKIVKIIVIVLISIAKICTTTTVPSYSPTFTYDPTALPSPTETNNSDDPFKSSGSLNIYRSNIDRALITLFGADSETFDNQFWEDVTSSFINSYYSITFPNVKNITVNTDLIVKYNMQSFSSMYVLYSQTLTYSSKNSSFADVVNGVDLFQDRSIREAYATALDIFGVSVVKTATDEDIEYFRNASISNLEMRISVGLSNEIIPTENVWTDAYIKHINHYYAKKQLGLAYDFVTMPNLLSFKNPGGELIVVKFDVQLMYSSLIENSAIDEYSLITKPFEADIEKSIFLDALGIGVGSVEYVGRLVSVDDSPVTVINDNENKSDTKNGSKQVIFPVIVCATLIISIVFFKVARRRDKSKIGSNNESTDSMNSNNNLSEFRCAVRALLWRNYLHLRRTPTTILIEFLSGPVCILVLVLIKNSASNLQSTTIPPVFSTDNSVLIPHTFQDIITALNAKRICEVKTRDDGTVVKRISGMRYSSPRDKDSDAFWTMPFVLCDSRNCQFDGEDAIQKNYCEFRQLGVVAEVGDEKNNVANNHLVSFLNYLREHYPESVQPGNFLPSFFYPLIKLFESETELEEYVKSWSYGYAGPKLGAAIIFTADNSDAENVYSFKLRLNSTNFNNVEEGARPAARTHPRTDRLFEMFAKSPKEACEPSEQEKGGPTFGPLTNTCTGQYAHNGGLTIQRLVQDWILWQSGTEAKVSEGGVGFAYFPQPSYIESGFYGLVAVFIPLLVTLGLMPVVANSIRSIVSEKELRQKELLKVMGVSEGAIGISWFITQLIFPTISSGLLAAIISTQLYQNSSFPHLLLLWLMTMLNLQMYSSVIAAISKNATKGVLVGLLFYFVGYFTSASVDLTTFQPWIIAFTAFHPVTAFSYAFQTLGILEEAGVGLNSGTMRYSEGPSGYTYENALNALVINVAIWGIVGWYLNRVVKGEYGRTYPFNFPFLVSYWFPDEVIEDIPASLAKVSGSESISNERQSHTGIPIEPVSSFLKDQEVEGKCVSIHGLTKKFLGNKTAVDGLTLNMYSGHVTALLGHNGAGKTTTIAMLTGMISPTSGHAVIAGKDLRTDLSQVRKGVGICLQHDCLFPLLTVKEHLQFYATIKGMYNASNKDNCNVNDKLRVSMQDVALLDKENTQSRNLSGGQKRKLSVGIAFIGNPRVVFLDEPTSGMDPFSRRFTWNVIRRYKVNRCIILTTHFMDEADILGDRVAIMANGKLRCVGSTLFLKKSFGVGYQLSIEKKHVRASTSSSAQLKNVREINNNTFNNKNDEELSPDDMKDSNAASSSDDSVMNVKDKKYEDTPPDRILPSIDTEIKNIVCTSPDAKILSNVGTEILFQLPLSSSSRFQRMFQLLQEKVKEGKIVTYGISVTTLDEVFLMVAKGENDVEKSSNEASQNLSEHLYPSDDMYNLPQSDGTIGQAIHPSIELEDDGIFVRHISALLKKRAMNFKRDKKAWFCSTVLPAILALFGFVTVILVAPDRDMEPLTLNLATFNTKGTVTNKILYNPSGGIFNCNPGYCMGQSMLGNITAGTEESYTYCGYAGRFNHSKICDKSYCSPQCTISKSDAFMAGVDPTDTRWNNASPQPISTDSNSLEQVSREIMDSVDADSTQYGGIFFTHDSLSTIVGTSSLYSEKSVAACESNLGDYITQERCSEFRGVGYIVSSDVTSLHSSIVYQALADEIIMNESSPSKQGQRKKIVPTVHPLPLTAIEEEFAQSEDSFISWFVLVFSFPFITGTFATFIVSERMSKALHLQKVAGISPSAYWMSSYFWDIANYQIPCWTVIALMFITGIDAFTTSERDCAFGTIISMVLFGPAAAGHTYLMTFFFTNPASCNFFVIASNFFFGFGCPLIVYILRLFLNEKLNIVAKTLEWFFRFIPSFNLGKSLFFICNIVTLEVLAGKEVTVWSPEVMLYETIFLGIECIAYITLTITLDKFSSNPNAVQNWKIFLNLVTLGRSSATFPVKWDIVQQLERNDDEDVADEEKRVLRGDANNELIVLKKLTKLYGGRKFSKLAVDNFCLGIPVGECFGLLGVNGAGKTTTMGILTGDIAPSFGDAWLDGFSVTSNPEQARRRIGYCPQFDAHFMNMTGREHVELYATIKGIPHEQVKIAAGLKLKEVGLSNFDSDRISSFYSGGMKRKLSVACATIGGPQIVFLDEPSTGMDPVSRRDLWKVILNMIGGPKDIISGEYIPKTSVILTTHSMEECEALCSRIGIMASGKLRCIGSAQSLKNRFGKGFQVEMKVKEPLIDDKDLSKNYKYLLEEIFSPDDKDDKVNDAASTFTRESCELSHHEVEEIDVESTAASTTNTFFDLKQTLKAVNAMTGNNLLSSMINLKDQHGYLIFKAATSEIGVSLDTLAAFCTHELRIKSLTEFMRENYPNSFAIRERQDCKVRFEVGLDGVNIGSLFGIIEESKDALWLADYGVSQTSLEQVFNMKVAESLRDGTANETSKM